jgi:hypothetical protein
LTQFESQQSPVVFYHREGNQYLPTAYARSFWDPELQSGHVQAPLLASLVEAVPSLVAMTPVRCVLNITRPVRMEPVDTVTQVLREGKKIQIVRAALVQQGVELADLTVVRIRQAESPVVSIDVDFPTPNDCFVFQEESQPGGFELRTAESMQSFSRRAFWMKMNARVLPDEPVTPLQHLMTLGDFGAGMPGTLDFKQWKHPNIDISCHLYRLPVGEWLLQDVEYESAGNGFGVGSARMADSQGVFGRSHQTVIIDKW